jgi:ABC-2 type transport system ATP-binding protein
MESVEELCDEIALIHKSNKILDGPLIDIKRQFRTHTFEVGLITENGDAIMEQLQKKYQILPATFKSITNDLKLNVQLKEDQTSKILLQDLSQQAEVSHFVEVIPSANDIFIQTVNKN